jgi:hypothetical protein
VWILGGPAAYHFNGLVCPGSPPWRMFEHDSLGVTVVKLTRLDADGQEQPADRYAPFGATSALDAPDEVRAIDDLAGAERVAQAICRSDPHTEAIRIALRHAGERGWDREPASLVACRPMATNQKP